MRAAAATYRSADKVNRAKLSLLVHFRTRVSFNPIWILAPNGCRTASLDRYNRTDFAAVALPMFGGPIRAQVLACFDPRDLIEHGSGLM